MAGRLRKRLAVLLNEVGIDIKPDDLSAAEGIHRQDNISGTYRWAGWVKRDGRRVLVFSISTMTWCVRYGFIVEPRTEGLEIVGNDPP